MRFKIGLLTAFIFSSIAFASEDYQNQWWYQKNIVINTAIDGANTSALVTNFPVLVRLNAAQSDVFLQAEAGGADIRFSKANGVTPLPFQIANWNAANLEAEIWVLVDSVQPNNDAQYIRMFWGNSDAADSSNPQVVFDTSNGYQAVWHMNDSSGNASDATPNGLTAIAVNSPGSTASGPVGPARTFDGSSQYFYPNSSETGSLNFHMTNSYTISAWVRPTVISTVIDDGNAILDKGNNQYILQSYSNGATKRWGVTTRGNNTFLQDTSIGTVTANGSVGGWHHLVGVYRGADSGSTIAESLYYDGSLVNTLSTNYLNTIGRGESLSVFIGALGGGSAPNGSSFSRYWNGALGEIEVSNQARSANWTKLSYATQVPGTSCLQYGPTMPSSGGYPSTTWVDSSGDIVNITPPNILLENGSGGIIHLQPGGGTQITTDLTIEGETNVDTLISTVYPNWTVLTPTGLTLFDTTEYEGTTIGVDQISIQGVDGENSIVLNPDSSSRFSDGRGDTTIINPNGIKARHLSTDTLVSADPLGDSTFVTPDRIVTDTEILQDINMSYGFGGARGIGEYGNDVNFNVDALYLDHWFALSGGGDVSSNLTPGDLYLADTNYSGDTEFTDVNMDGISTTGSLIAGSVTTGNITADTAMPQDVEISYGFGGARGIGEYGNDVNFNVNALYLDHWFALSGGGDVSSNLTPGDLYLADTNYGADTEFTDLNAGGIITTGNVTADSITATDNLNTNNLLTQGDSGIIQINDYGMYYESYESGGNWIQIGNDGIKIVNDDAYGATFITDTGIQTGSINTGYIIAEGKVTADSISANALTTTAINTGRLTASGNITADSITATAVVTTPEWTVPDYVFEKGYQQQSLKDLEAFVEENKHLPDVPSAAEMKNGVNIGEMDLRLLKNVEELTLHVIDINKELEEQRIQNATLEEAVQSLTIQREGK